MARKQGEKELIALLEHKKEKSARIMKFPTKGKRTEERRFKILDYLIHRQSNSPHKYLTIEVIQPSWHREKELRFGYYILGKKRKVYGKWVWGQFAPLIPLKDLRRLLKKAKRKGLIKFRIK